MIRLVSMILAGTLILGADRGLALNAEVDDLVEEVVCLYRAEVSLKGFQRILRVWLVDPASAFFARRKFDELTARHAEHLAKQKAFAAEETRPGESLDAIQRRLAKLGGGQGAMLSEQRDLFLAEHQLAMSLHAIERGLETFKVEAAYFATARCKDTVGAIFASNAVVADDWSRELNLMRTYIVQAREKRVELFTAVVGAVRLTLETQYARMASAELRDVQRSLDAILAADRLYGEILGWWREITDGRGEDARLDTKYLQFQRPLMLYRGDLARGKELQARAAAISGAPDAVIAPVRAEIGNYVRHIEARIQDLQSQGWERQLARQRQLVRQREAILDRYAAACAVAISAYKGREALFTSLETFSEAEALYARVVGECVRREP